MVTLGLSLVGHDRSLCVLRDDTEEPVFFVEDERYSRIKGGRLIGPPERVLRILDEFGVAPSSIDCLALASIPSHMELRTATSRSLGPPFGYARAEGEIERRILAWLPGVQRVVRFKHHLCHAASAYFPSGFEEAAVLTVDGKGEDETSAIHLAEGDSMRRITATPLPHSLGYLYTNVALWAGLRGHECEGKLMGLAGHGDPGCASELRRAFLGSPVAGQVRLSDGLAAIRCDRPAWQRFCAQVLGPPRAPDEPITARERDVAAGLQRLLEEEILRLAWDARRATGARRLCAAGGTLLNSVANGLLARSGIFDEIYIPPWTADMGLSLGAALLASGRRRTRQRAWRPFLGSAIEPNEVAAALTRRGLRAEPYSVGRVVNALCEGQIVGWVRGRMEVGPRALGNRSILAHPGRRGIRDRLNACVKNRETWRPFAPVILRERAEEFFEAACESPFMNLVFRARERARVAAPEAIHVDGTARLQTLTRQDNPALHELLDAFARRTDLPMLINTSYNVQGQPIVRDAEEAIATFLSTAIDLLVLGDEVIARPGPPVPEPRRLQLRMSERALSLALHSRSVRLLAREPNTVVDELAFAGIEVLPLLEGSAVRDLDAVARAVALSDDDEILAVVVPAPASLALELLPAVLAPFAARAGETLVCGDDDLVLLLHEELLRSRTLGPSTELDHVWTSPSRGRSRYWQGESSEGESA